MGVEEQLPLALRLLQYFLARTPEKPSVTGWTSRGVFNDGKGQSRGQKDEVFSMGGSWLSSPSLAAADVTPSLCYVDAARKRKESHGKCLNHPRAYK
jgi:hypothetical protein